MNVASTRRRDQAARTSIPHGQMTAVMRAVAPPTGPKVLRIGVVRGGQIVEDRILKRAASVTVGPTEDALIAVTATYVTAPFELFEHRGGHYYINVVPWLAGRVALGPEVVDVVTLRERGWRERSACSTPGGCPREARAR